MWINSRRHVEIGGKKLVLTIEDKKGLIDKYKLHEADTGSPEVQIGLLNFGW